MEKAGVHTYLLLLDPVTLTVLWANENVDATVVARSGESVVGRRVTDVIPFAEALGIPQRLEEVARTGETQELHSVGFSVERERTRTSASMYRLPSGQLLLASEYEVAGVLS